jgi:hypothetical protein
LSGQRHLTRSATFSRADFRFPRERPADDDLATSEVNVAPAQGYQLATAQTGRSRDAHELGILRVLQRACENLIITDGRPEGSRWAPAASERASSSICSGEEKASGPR